MKQKPLAAEKMTTAELQAAATLALIFFLRMLGLFLLLPVFSPQAMHLKGATLRLVGLAAGAYGLTQAIFQIPFGTFSDRYGRKRTITVGLLVFAAGSAVAALSTSIYGVMLGRALQGAGAISAAVMALAADLTREEQRTKAMAFIGMSIGLSFSLAFILGPAINHWAGLAGVFWTSAALAIGALLILHLVVPNPPRSTFHRDCETETSQLGSILRNRELLRLNTGIFCLHTILIASFVAVPLALRTDVGMPLEQHWRLYLPVMFISVLLMMPFVRRADTHGGGRIFFLGAVVLVGLAQVGLWLGHTSLWNLAIALTLFFTGFNFLEASLPALISRAAPPERKGTAMGVYSTSQFLGTFLGGACGGSLAHAYGLGAVFLFCAAVAACWLAVARGMKEPDRVVTYLLRIGSTAAPPASDVSARLMAVPGVREAVVVAEEGVAYLKVNPDTLDRDALHAIAGGTG